MECHDCGRPLYDRVDSETGFTELICWACGHYESNSPAFEAYPEMFKGLARERFVKIPPDAGHPKKSPDYWTVY